MKEGAGRQEGFHIPGKENVDKERSSRTSLGAKKGKAVEYGEGAMLSGQKGNNAEGGLLKAVFSPSNKKNIEDKGSSAEKVDSSERLRSSFLEKGFSEKDIETMFAFADIIKKQMQTFSHEKSSFTGRLQESPYAKEVSQHLLSIEGPVNIRDPRHGAMHGTSIEVIEYLFKYGVIPGVQGPRHESRSQKGDISFYPTECLYNSSSDIRESLYPYGVARVTKHIENSYQDAVEYANTIAEIHGVLSVLGMPLSDRSQYTEDLTALLYATDGFLEMVSMGIPQEEIMRLRHHGLSRKGFLLGFSHDFLTEPGFSIEEGDAGDADLTLRTAGKGLGYNLISGIQALGPQEEAFLRSLKK